MRRVAATAIVPVVLLLVCADAAPARDGIATRRYDTRRLDGDAPRLDGRVDDPAWQLVEWSGDFVQRQPTDGAQPTHQTRFKVLYDDDALYFAFRAYDDPARVTSRLARRDWFPGDWIEVNIDSRGDRRTAYSFTLSLSSTRGDEYISDDGQSWDGNWDPVWEGATAIDAEGWTAEMRIPLSQLRFDARSERTWGLQVQRNLFREGERSTWQEIPRDTRGWVSKFGDLCGIADLAPAGRAEILPYVVAQHARYAPEDGNPFRDGTDNRLSAGLDAKLGLGNDFSLDLTVNPDFGQVEADPSEVNLTAFETFFQEKRPFFVEGADVFSLPLAPAITGGPFTRDRLFYSRRIGRSPSYSPDLAADEYADLPGQTTILGAAKVSGKTAGGLAAGFLESVTARERADISGPAGERRETVEPLTSYLVGRVTQDLRGGDTVVGAMLTSVVRDIDDPHLEFLERQAWAGGVDLLHYFHGRDFRLEARLFGSHLRGAEASIFAVQTASARYFQRPDNDHASLDSTRTALDGHAGSVMLLRTGNNSNLMWQVGGAWRSPGVEINDLGYMQRADELNQFGWMGYVKRNPFWIFNSWQLNGNEWLDWDFGGTLLRQAVNVNTNGQLRSQHQFYAGVTRSFEEVSNTALRGGPSSLWPGSTEVEASFNTDQRRKLYGGLGAWLARCDEDSRDVWNGWVDLVYQPTNSLRLALSPSYGENRDQLQYVQTSTTTAGDRYLFGRLDQHTFAVTFRCDLCLTPDLTVQYYGSPFVSAGAYDEFKRSTDPLADRYEDRFHTFTDAEITRDGDRYAIDENADGSTDYTIADPDFNVRDFNSNLVVRWEYAAGSTVYLVWSQGRSDVVTDGRFDLHQDLDALFATHPTDVFLVKINTWLPL